MLSFDFTPNKEDYLKAFSAYYSGRLQQWLAMAFLLTSFIVCSLYGLLSKGAGLGFLIPIAIFIFMIVYPVSVFVINPRIMANKIEKDERLNSPVHYEVTDEQVLIKTKFVETKFDWGSFQRVIETKELFLLIHSVNKNMLQIIPRRAFASVVDEQAFRNLLELKLLRV